jgi:hypothetical protein
MVSAKSKPGPNAARRARLKRLDSAVDSKHCRRMGLPNQPVTLTVEQIGELNRKLSKMRHDINNHLSTIVAAIELAQYRPETAERMWKALGDQPPRILQSLATFSEEFEQTFGIVRS